MKPILVTSLLGCLALSPLLYSAAEAPGLTERPKPTEAFNQAVVRKITMRIIAKD